VSICGVVLGRTTEQIKSNIMILNDLVDLIEIRFDYSEEELDLNIIKKASKRPLIATNRRYEEGGLREKPLSERLNILIEASQEGYQFVDLELSIPKLEDKISVIRKNGVNILCSYHDFVGTPTIDLMENLHFKAMKAGADKVKIIGTATKKEDNLVYLTYNQRHPGNVSFGMGEEGIISRIISPLMGASFTYASLGDMKSAPGQVSVSKLKEIYQLMGVDR
jgi:3-dehydroquinate dehydratase type I